MNPRIGQAINKVKRITKYKVRYVCRIIKQKCGWTRVQEVFQFLANAVTIVGAAGVVLAFLQLINAFLPVVDVSIAPYEVKFSVVAVNGISSDSDIIIESSAKGTVKIEEFPECGLKISNIGPGPAMNLRVSVVSEDGKDFYQKNRDKYAEELNDLSDRFSVLATRYYWIRQLSYMTHDLGQLRDQWDHFSLATGKEETLDFDAWARFVSLLVLNQPNGSMDAMKLKLEYTDIFNKNHTRDVTINIHYNIIWDGSSTDTGTVALTFDVTNSGS